MRLPSVTVLLTGLLSGLLLALAPVGPAPASAAPASAARAGTAPSEEVWLADVGTAVAGVRPYLRQRAAAAAPGERLAINLDIDNTSLATYYDRGQAVRKVRNLARLADRLGMSVLFNTGRARSNLGAVPQRLRAVGYDVGAICTRRTGEVLPEGKQRCRASFVAQGYTLVLNVGNNDTDFAGGDYERKVVLPDYDGALA